MGRPTSTLLLLCLALCPSLALGGVTPLVRASVDVALGEDDEIVKEFKKYFRKYEDTPTRVEAVMALDGVDSVAVVDALLPVLQDKEVEVSRAAVEVLAGLESAAARARVWTLLDKKKAEAVRVGLLQAISKGGYTLGTEDLDPQEVLVELLEDKSWQVRRKSVAAVVTLGSEQSAAAIAPLCSDKEAAVRCSALEGLAQLSSELVLAPALRALQDSVWQVRASAIHALARVRHRDSIGPLIERMKVEEGRLVKDLGDALAEITGRDFGQRTEAWTDFWGQYSERFEIPTDEELARLREVQRQRREEYSPPGAISYHGIETPSRSILFVIDVSGSMENLVIETERFEDGEYPSYARIDIVKTELARTLKNLEPYVRFNVFAFATELKSWKKGLVSANVLNKSSSIDWVGKLEAIGGSSKEDLARAGLVGSANLAAGKTNTYAALMGALEVAGQGMRDEHYEVSVDTIFFLSDGRPSHGKYVDTHDILREVRAANELRKVVIHTIALGEFQKSFMRSLARENGGVFVDLGR